MHHKVRAKPLDWWTAEFAEIAPIGHALRVRLHEKWVRFHSLPESKRYAEDVAEHVELLKRHLAVANELFEMGERVYLFRSRFEERKLKGRRRHQVAGRQLREEMVRLPTGLAEDGDDAEHYCVRALVTAWIPDFFNILTRQVADWEESGIALVSPSSKNIYCPYDGGMDVFVYSQSPSSLESKFRSWMSNRVDGL